MNSKFLKAVLPLSLVCSVFFMGQEAFANASISAENAKEIALKHAKITDGNAFFSQCKLDIDNGTSEYDIEFFHNNMEYEFEINATDGEIKSFSQEKQKSSMPHGMDMTKYVSEEEAKNIALKHANIPASKIQHSQIDFDMENGHGEYEVDLYENKTKHEYEINATTGEITSTKKEFMQK